MNLQSLELQKLVNAQLSEIHVMARDADLSDHVVLYAKAMSFFMTGDTERLELLEVEALKSNGRSSQLTIESKKINDPLFQDILKLVRFRIGLRKKTVQKDDILQLMKKEFYDVLEAEKYFLIGRAWEHLKDDTQNCQNSLKAYHLYKKYNCSQKSIRAFYNSIVAESRLYPYKNFLSEYQSIIEMSKAVHDTSFAGMCLVMLSREYQIVGLLDKALSCAQDGLIYLESERGSLHYFNAILQKCHILIQQNQKLEAHKILQECTMASFLEIKSAFKFLMCLIDQNQVWNSEDEKYLLPTWHERLSEIYHLRVDLSNQAKSLATTFLEEKVLKLLWSGPLAKWDLIAKIYPDEADSLVLENRFKNLAARVRKKFPNVLQFHDGKYFVVAKPSLLDQEV